MSRQLGRTAVAAGAVIAILALAAIGGVKTGLIAPPPQSQSQNCAGASSLTPTLFGSDTSTQIRLSTPDLKSQRVLRTEPTDRLPAMFENLLALSPDGRRLAYVTADDEQMDNAQLSYIEVDHPDAPHVIATERSGMLPIRPVWSPRDAQVAFVVARRQQSGIAYRVLAASTTGGPVLDIGTLGSNAFESLETNVLCVTPAGSVSVLPPPAPTHGDLATSATPVTHSIPAATPTPTPATVTGGGTRCALPALSQNDPRWSAHRMQPTGESVGEVGCAVTSAAMVLDYWSSNLTPDQLSDCLGGSAVPIHWARATACSGGLVTGATESNFSWATLDSILAAGRPAIVGMLGGPVGMHFVVVTTGGGDVADRYTIVDPWNGRNDETLGSYTRQNWTLFEVVDFRSAGPGCGKLLITTRDGTAGVVGGISDGAWYHAPVTLNRLVQGVTVQVELISHQKKADQKWVLDTNPLTLTADGNYRVIIGPTSNGELTVLSFVIDTVPPTIGVTFLGRTSTVKGKSGANEPVVYLPGGFVVTAHDTVTQISSIQAQLNGAPVKSFASVVSFANSRLVSPLTAPGEYNLTFSTTNAAGLSTSGHVTFVVQAMPINLGSGQTGNSTSGQSPAGNAGAGGKPSPTQSGNTSSGTGSTSGSGSGGTSSGSPVTVPTAPSIVTVVAGPNGFASVFWSAPASNGGSPITGYIITVSPGGARVSVPPNFLGWGISSLTNGTSYTFTVTATNAIGTGPPSSPSKPVTPYCGGTPLTSVTLTVSLVGGGNQLQWLGNGSCNPYSGTITATYYTVQFFGSPTTSTASYAITGESGTLTDSHSAGTQWTKYVLVLKDANGNSAQTTATGS